MLLEQCGIQTMKNDNLSLLSKSLYMISLFRSRTKKRSRTGQARWHVFFDTKLLVLNSFG